MRQLRSLAKPLKIGQISWTDAAFTVGPVLLVILLGFWAAVHFVKPAPPRHLTMTSGPEGSAFRGVAEEYKEILARDGVTLKILPSRGGHENLERLGNLAVDVDVGLVQSGLAAEKETEGLVSLGSIYYEPLWVFYRGQGPRTALSELSGLRLAIGAVGGGTRVFARRLLKANGVDASNATLLEVGNEDAVAALRAGQVDAAFLLGNSTTPVVRELLASPGIGLMSFLQADAYTRRFPYLYKLILPRGALDLGRDRPGADVVLVGPTAELVAREDLHPALSDLLIEAAQEVHGGPGMFRKAGEFPAPREHDFALSEDAERFYKSGRRLLHKHLPFWLANLLDRALVLLVPLVALVLPAFRLAPALYRWRLRTRLYRWYGELMTAERETFAGPSADERADILRRLDLIEESVNAATLPLSLADQVYVLRQHIGFVRDRLGAAG